MQIKHSFLLSLMVGLLWTGYLFAHVLGPDPAMNGIFGPQQTCNVAGCHSGNPLNASGGSVTLSGLPATWTPGQVYPLTVTIARTGQRVFGFQLSAVADGTNQQAGTLAPGNNRVQVICGLPTGVTTQQVPCTTAGAIQYAEHVNATLVTSTYLVNWTAPSSASVGTVRFNTAGNAANGDLQPTGDFIYTRVDKVDAGVVQPPPGVTTLPFTMVDRGGMSVITDGSGDLNVGYSRIQPGAGSTTPSGVAIFGFRQGSTLVTEAGVPASPLLTSARMYGEVAGPVNTGVAIANPNGQAATIQFKFTDTAGVDFGGGSLVIQPNQQIAQFLDNPATFNVLAGRNPFQGTFSFTSDVPVSVIALRGFLNERNPAEFLITTLPVANLGNAPGNGPVTLAHFADGAGWVTQIVLVNPTEAPITGTIQFFGQGSLATAATPLTISASGQTAATFNYNIPARSSFKLVTSGTAAATAIGSVRVTPTAGASPSSLVIFSYKPGPFTVSEAGVPGTQASTFRMYGEETGLNGVGAIQTGIAIANLSPTVANVSLELTTLDGASIGQSTTVQVGGNGQVAKFIHDFFPSLPLPFKGLVRISGGGAAGLSVVGLRGRYNERTDFLITTTPPINEATPASAAELLFPHLVNGGGYTTQFILFSGTAGQASSGNLNFFKQGGAPLNLVVN